MATVWRRPSTTTAIAPGSTSSARPPMPRGDGVGHTCFARHLGLEHMAFHGVQGRGVLVDLAHHLGHDFRGVRLDTLREIMAADNVVVEPGDMLLFHTGFATEILAMDRNPDPVKIFRMCTWLDARRRAARMDHRLADLGARRRQLRGRRSARQGQGSNPPLVPTHPPPLPVRARGAARRDVVLARAATWLREHDRNRFLLTAPPLRLPGIVGSPLTPVATV